MSIVIDSMMQLCHVCIDLQLVTSILHAVVLGAQGLNTQHAHIQPFIVACFYWTGK